MMRKLWVMLVSVAALVISISVFVVRAQETETKTKTNFMPKNVVDIPQDERKSAKPRMVEVEEELWYKLNQDVLKMEDELLKSKTELKVAQAEIERLKQSKKTVVVAGSNKKQAEEHRVKKNESLWKIALHYYNDAYKWHWIYKANIKQIDDPNAIYPEQILDIPRY
jgi:hypothetical protein